MKAALVIAAALLAAPTSAAADAGETVPMKAKRLATKGRELHDRGDYQRAIVAFKEAYVIAPSPALLFNLAQAYRLQGNCDDASLMYKRYLSTRPDRESQRIAAGHLATVDRCVAQRNLGIRLDPTMAYLQQPHVPTPAEAILEDRPLAADAPSPGKRKKRLGIGLAAGGGVGMAAALYFGIQSAADADAVEKAYARGAKWKDVQDLDARGKRNATYAKVLGVTGGLAAAAGITLFVVGKREERATQITIMPSAGGAQVSYGWRF